ncbi:MAG TPA: helix-turn-helix transcriptional regulator [Polyangiaceae bacterium]
MLSPDRLGIGGPLRALRLRLRWSQKELAGRMKLRHSDISLLESGRNRGTSGRIRKLLAAGFGVDAEVFEAYLSGALSLEQIAQRIPRLAQGEHRSKKRPKVLADLPKLAEAVRLVVRDAGVDEGIVREAAVRLAEYPGIDRDKGAVEWAALLKNRVSKLRSGVRMNPFRLPGLATAIRLLAQEHPLEEQRIIDVAARLASSISRPEEATGAAWFRTLDRDLGFEPLVVAPRAGKGRGKARRRPAKQG